MKTMYLVRGKAMARFLRFIKKKFAKRNHGREMDRGINNVTRKYKTPR